MSLATSGMSMGGGAAGGGGLVMAHQGNAMQQVHEQAQAPNMEGTATVPPGMMGTNVAALGADLVDKSVHLSMKLVRNVSHLPIVAMDFHGSSRNYDDLIRVACFPPKQNNTSANGDDNHDEEPLPANVLNPSLVGKTPGVIYFEKTENAHKVLRKYLKRDRSFADLEENVIIPASKARPSDKVIQIDHPHLYLGYRRLEEVPTYVTPPKTPQKVEEVPSSVSAAAISEEASQEDIFVTNGTLDCVSAPVGAQDCEGSDDDRLVYKLRLAENKKALTILPDELAALIVAQAQGLVANKRYQAFENEDVEAFPVAVALPGWLCSDFIMDSWLQTLPPGSVLFQRSVAALCGSLLPYPDPKSPNPLLVRLANVTKAMERAHQVENDGTIFSYEPLVVMVGLTEDGVECTAVQVSEIQKSPSNCVYGNFKVLCQASIPKPEGIKQCMEQLYKTLERVAPEVEGPAAFVAYTSHQDELDNLSSVIQSVRTTLETWEKVPIIASKFSAVTMGTAVLAAVAHGRLQTIPKAAGDGGGKKKKKPKPLLGIRVQNVAPCAVGVQMTYHYKDGAPASSQDWMPIRTIFDFDRRVPAGPYTLELNAAACAAWRACGDETKDVDQDFISEEMKKYEGRKGIPKREEAALGFALQLVQKMTRDGEWTKVGNVARPLSQFVPDKEDKRKEVRVAYEKVNLELSLGPTGLMTQELVGQLETVVQATKSAQSSKFRYYLGVGFAILFCGGFLVKSYWDEHVFARDTERLLAYYKHVLPGSLADGDERNARYLVWKYRGKKEKLWKRLEVKYGEPVRHVHEWPEEEVKDEGTKEEEDVEDLDAEEEEDKEEL